MTSASPLDQRLATTGQAHLLRHAEALGTVAASSLAVGQVPFRPDDRWIGLAGAGSPGVGQLSLVAWLADPPTTGRPLAGMVVDEWQETLPAPEALTGVALNVDRPGARAPQAVLLAVAPDGRAAWDLATLEATLLETLELAKLRAVDPATLGEVGQYLPALLFANNAAGDAVSTDFARAAAAPTPGA